MDYISVSSQIIESWDFTQSPVRGLKRDIYGERSIDDIFQYSDIIWSKGVRKKLTRRKEPYRHRQTVESSTSLILKKTIDRKAPYDYSASSISDILLPHNPVYGDSDDKFTATDGKPLIKVTVIPHSPHHRPHQYEEAYIQHRNITRPPKPIIPKADHSFNTKNFYLVVAGCKNQKIYELNTRSGKGETCKNEAFLNENEFKEYFEANMNKNKRKLTTKNENLLSDEYITDTCTQSCRCPSCRRRSSQDMRPGKTNGGNRTGVKNKSNKGRNDPSCYKIDLPSPASRNSSSSRAEVAITRKGVTNVPSPKSRIKITGRLGLTAEDKYILKCDATLDDKPIPTHFQTTEYEMETRRTNLPLPTPIQPPQRCSLDLCYRAPKPQQRDSSIQADTRYVPCSAFEYERSEVYSSGCRNEPSLKKVRDSNVQADSRFIPCPAFEITYHCQATQVNFDITRPNRAIFNEDKIVQCCCPVTAENSTYTPDTPADGEEISLKPCPSPIVVISVYPNQDSTEIVTKNKAEDKYTTQIEYSQKGKQKINNKTKISAAASRSRSPSPVKAIKKDKDTQMKSTTTFFKPVHDSIPCPGRKKTKSSNVQTVNQMKQTVNLAKTTITTKKSEQKSKSPTRSPSPGRRKDSPKTKPNNNSSTGTNTDQMLTKKALVDDFTKHMTEMNEKKTRDGFGWGSKHTVSNVTVNIEGDNEHYNVKFRQGELDTDLIVRKINKGIMTQQPEYDENASLANFLLLHPDEHRKTSHSQTLLLEGNNTPHNRTSSNINVVDSIEISHRREDKTNIVGKTTQTKNGKQTINEVDNEYLAPIKHFHGDECSITDPIERDLEIRALLGIDKGRFKPPERATSKAHNSFGFGSEVSLHYIYHYQQSPSKSEEKKSRPMNKKIGSESLKQDVYAPVKKASLYQQLVLSKNFQVLLELKQTKKEKPIVLTHQQYTRVRKTLCHALVKNNSVSKHTKLCTLKGSVVSVGNVRTKPKENLIYHYNKECQTEALGVSFSMIQTDSKIFGNHDFDLSSKTDNEEVLRLINDFSKRDDCSNSNASEPTCETVDVKETDDSKQLTLECKDSVLSADHAAHADEKNLSNLEQHETTVLYNASQTTYKKTSTYNKAYPRRAASSLEVHFASASCIRNVNFSSSDIVRGSISPRNSVTSQNLEPKESVSIHTIFNGHRKTYTPNLGASAFSLCADGASERFDTRFPYIDDSNLNLKPKKPFLRRLISCLVLRASRASNTKFLPGPVLNKPSINSSLDSYHINTSLEGVEMSSSVYDTTASFYSNHTILPTRRMRRGFFCSVRGFLNRS